MSDQPAQIDIRSINPDDTMERWHTAALITHLNQSDARVQATKANITIWHETLNGLRFRDVIDATHGFYRDYNPKSPDRDALDIGTLGHLLRERKHYLERRHREIEEKRGSRMPRRVLERLQANGILTDRDPSQYT